MITKIAKELSKEVRKGLGDYAHDAWSRWMMHLFSRSTENKDGTVTIPADRVKQWKRQMITPYPELTKGEQASDLAEADKMIEVVKEGRDLTAGRLAKTALISGHGVDLSALNDVPEDMRLSYFVNAHKAKAQEPESSWKDAVKAPAITGGVLGALPAVLRRRWPKIPLGAGLGALAGTGLGALAKKNDDLEIAKARQITSMDDSNMGLQAMLAEQIRKNHLAETTALQDRQIRLQQALGAQP